MGDVAIFSGIMKDTVLPASNPTSTGCPGGLPVVTILPVCGTVSCTCTTNSLKLPFTPYPYGGTDGLSRERQLQRVGRAGAGYCSDHKPHRDERQLSSAAGGGGLSTPQTRPS